MRCADDGLGELVAEIGGARLVNGGVIFGERQRDAHFLKIFWSDEIAGLQFLLSLEFALSALHFQLGGLDIALGLLQLREDVLLVESQDFLLALDGLAIGDENFNDAAADLGAQFGRKHGAEPADRDDFLRDVRRLDAGGGDLGLALIAEQAGADFFPNDLATPAQTNQDDEDDGDAQEGLHPRGSFGRLGHVGGIRRSEENLKTGDGED